MIPKKVKDLIDQYCMGVEPTAEQYDEIFAAVDECNVDQDEVASYIEKLQKGSTKEQLCKEQEAKRKAEEEELECLYTMGDDYYFGRNGIKQNYTEAVKCYRKAAEQGHAGAQCSLGFCYDNGLGVNQSDEEAVKWFRKAAEQGDASAQCNLGECYQWGLGVNKSDEEAVKWFRKAAEQGNASAQSALKKLGIIY